MLIAAVIGGVLVLGGGFALQQTGMIKLAAEADPETMSALRAAERKITALERQIGDAGNGSAVSALERKVTALEDRVASAGSAELSSAVEALKADVGELRGASGSGGGAADLGPIEARLSTLESASAEGSSADIGPLEDRLSALETSTSATSSEAEQLSGTLGELQATITDLGTRLDNTEATAKAAQTAVSTSDVSLKTLADSQARAAETLATLSSEISAASTASSTALDEIRGELEGLSKRLAAVEATMGDATAREVAARALSVSALKSAVDSGRPYETELAAVKAGLPGDIDLAALEAHAATGVEPVPVLIAQFPPVARKVYQSFGEPDRSGDVLDSLLSSAKSIVSVRGLGDSDGDGPEAALRRMEAAVAEGNLRTALSAYAELPDEGKAVAADWAERAKARVAADDLTDKASQEVLDALAGKDS